MKVNIDPDTICLLGASCSELAGSRGLPAQKPGAPSHRSTVWGVSQALLLCLYLPNPQVFHQRQLTKSTPNAQKARIGWLLIVQRKQSHRSLSWVSMRGRSISLFYLTFIKRGETTLLVRPSSVGHCNTPEWRSRPPINPRVTFWKGAVISLSPSVLILTVTLDQPYHRLETQVRSVM
jgi:hypothetical protein